MAAECDVMSEIEVLQSIYLDELLVNRAADGSWQVSLVLHPSTAEDSVSQFVRLTLTMTLDQQYPSTSPSISIHNPRGLSDDKINSVQRCLQAEAQSSLGSPVLYQLIEKAKEILTESNIPHGNCVICLYDFKEGEILTKTSCYHYFHSHCLGRYVSHSERELQLREKELEEDKTRDRSQQQELTVVCPVCREPLSYDVDQLLSCPAPQLPELDESTLSSDFQHRWRKLQKLLEKQRSKGGVIDPEEESNRFFIHINEAPSASENENLEVELPSPSNNKPIVRTEPCVPSMLQCRGDPSSVRTHSHGRGPRRGGRYRPVTEELGNLSLCADETKNTKFSAEVQLSNANRDVKKDTNQLETTAQAQVSSGPKTEPEQGARGRKRGLHYHSRFHWDGRGSRSRGGPHHNQCHRGGRDHRRGYQHRPMERDRNREEVL